MPPPSPARAIAAGVAGTTASILPAFMTGAVAVQLADGIGLTERALGLVIGAFFTSAALGSAVLGGWAQRLGPGTAMRVGLATTIVAGLGLSQARSPQVLGAVLVLAGASNALTQPAANLLLADHVPAHRLGVAVAIKQAGMPVASMLGGVAVPAIALTLGWPWAYGAAVVVAAAALTLIPSTGRGQRGRRTAPPRAVPDLPRRLLVGYALVGLLGAAAAGMLVTFLVTGAVAAGVEAGPAGLLLTGGSAVGITSRVMHGRWADRPGRKPIRRVALMLAGGGVAAGLLATDLPIAYLLCVPPAFGLGWAWPGLFNLSVVRNNPSAPAAATGITQTGIYIGAGGGPVVGGFVAEAAGQSVLWLVTAALLIVSGALAASLSRALAAHGTTPEPARGPVRAG